MKFSAILCFIAAARSADAFGTRSFGARRASSLSMNVENMPTKANVRVGVIGMYVCCWLRRFAGSLVVGPDGPLCSVSPPAQCPMRPCVSDIESIFASFLFQCAGMGRIGLVHLEAITKAPGVTPVIVSNPTISKAEVGLCWVKEDSTKIRDDGVRQSVLSPIYIL